MTRKYEEPKVTPDEHFGSKYEHPAYAIVNLTRISGGTDLFDSSFTHQHFIGLSIKRAVKYSDGASDHIMGKEQLIEVWMSESQFARIITSMNMGSGGPCTLVRFNGTGIPGLAAEDRLTEHREMMQTKLTDVMDAQLALGKQIKDWREAKHRPTLAEMDELSTQMHLISSNFKANMGFYAQCLEEHMERVVDDAKTEIEAHVLKTAGRLGIDRDELPQLENK